MVARRELKRAIVQVHLTGHPRDISGIGITMSSTPLISVVAPCYNEAESLPEFYRRVTEVCRREVGDNFEIVLVDDGSTDGSRTAIEHLCLADAKVVGVLLSRNHGHQLALSAGLGICKGERILVIDGDLQDPPELLTEMLPLMDEGADVVYGTRTARKGETKVKNVTAAAFYRLLEQMTDIKIPRDTGDFRLMSRRVLDVLNAMPEQHRFIRGMVSWIGFRQVPIAYVREPRFAGRTKYPLRKMINFAIDAITGFSVTPLRLATHLGFWCALIGGAFLMYTLVGYFSGVAIQGWTTLMAAVLILGSGQLLVLGVIGEYLGRLYMQSKGRPLFIIEKVVRADASRPKTTIAAATSGADRSQSVSDTHGVGH